MQKPYNDRYHNQKTRAKRRGIEWQFTYEEWINWWGDDIVNRGCLKGQFVMARNGDVGPYHPTNVHKTTVEGNVKEALAGVPKTPEQIAKAVIGRAIAVEQRYKEKELA